MLKPCVLPVNNFGFEQGKATQPLHTPSNKTTTAGHKWAELAGPYTTFGYFLYTVFPQAKLFFQSVISVTVHNFHRPYDYNYYLYKGEF